jgi:hypothetical protein
VYAVVGGLVEQTEFIACDNVGHRPPIVVRLLSRFVIGSGGSKGGCE